VRAQACEPRLCPQLAISVKARPLNLEDTRCQAQMPALVCLISIEQAARHPDAAHVIRSLPDIVDAGERRTVADRRSAMIPPR
jgi:hypothetical protein